MSEQEMAVKLTEVDARSKSNTHRIDDLENKVDVRARLTTAVEVMAAEQNHQTETMGEIKKDVAALDAKVDTIEQKPAKKWDGMVEKLFYGVLGVLAAAMGAGLIHLLTTAT